MFRLILALALFAVASAFVRTPMRVQRALAPKMVPLEEVAFTVAQASEPIEGNPIFAFVLIAGAIMGSLPGFLSAFEKPPATK